MQSDVIVTQINRGHKHQQSRLGQWVDETSAQMHENMQVNRLSHLMRDRYNANLLTREVIQKSHALQLSPLESEIMSISRILNKAPNHNNNNTINILASVDELPANMDGDVFIKCFFNLEKSMASSMEYTIYQHVVGSRLIRDGHTPNLMISSGGFSSSFAKLRPYVPESEQRTFDKLIPSEVHDPETYCLVMERGHGMTLHQWQQVYGLVAEPEVWFSLMFQIVYTLECMQRVGLQHNNLCPENIWLEYCPLAPVHIYTVHDYPHSEASQEIRVPVEWMVKIFNWSRATALSYQSVPVNTDVESSGAALGQFIFHSPKRDLATIICHLFNGPSSSVLPQFIKNWIQVNASEHFLSHGQQWLVDPSSVPFLLSDSHLQSSITFLLTLIEIGGTVLERSIYSPGEPLPHVHQRYEMPLTNDWVERDISFLQGMYREEEEEKEEQETAMIHRDRFLRNLAVELCVMLMKRETSRFVKEFPLDIRDGDQVAKYALTLSHLLENSIEFNPVVWALSHCVISLTNKNKSNIPSLIRTLESLRT